MSAAVPVSSSISMEADSSGPSTRTTESRSPRSGGIRAGSIRSPASEAALEIATCSGHAAAATARWAIRPPTSLADTVSSGTSSIPPVALANAARQGQLTCGPIPIAENMMCFPRSVSMIRWKSSGSMPPRPGPSPI